MDNPRIIGDREDAGSLIPSVWAETLAQHLRPAAWVEAWRKSPEGQAAMARRKQEEEQAKAEQRRLIARHAELVAAEQNPVLAQLLREHAPSELDEVDRPVVCLSCSGYQCFECTEPTWPCTTWSTIEAGAS